MSNIENVTNTRLKSSYDEKGVLDEFKKEIMIEFNCHAIGTIQKFDPATQLVSVSINYKKTFLVPSGPADQSGIVPYRPNYVDYPITAEMPIYILNGGDFHLSMPIQVGDTCSILFNDRSLDTWLATGTVGPLQTPRLHSFSDGIALIGVRPFTKPYPSFDTTHALIRNADTKLGISATKILAKNAAGKSLNDLLQDLITAIKNISVAPGTFTNSGGPVTGAGVVSPGSQTSLNAVASNIGALLE